MLSVPVQMWDCLICGFICVAKETMKSHLEQHSAILTPQAWLGWLLHRPAQKRHMIKWKSRFRVLCIVTASPGDMFKLYQGLYP